jgi:hypothetical protein
MGKKRIIKAISSVVKPPTGGFFVFVICFDHCFVIQIPHTERALLPHRKRNNKMLFCFQNEKSELEIKVGKFAATTLYVKIWQRLTGECLKCES